MYLSFYMFVLLGILTPSAGWDLRIPRTHKTATMVLIVVWSIAENILDYDNIIRGYLWHTVQ
jgi:hypothetical protein